MSSNYYNTLWVDKTASEIDIKKAYRKKAMEFHPDRNKWNENAETKFKEVNKAYDTLGNAEKKKQYDMFGSSWWAWNPFWWAWWWANYSSAWFWWFEDLFWWGWGGRQTQSSNFNFEDLFWWGWMWGQSSTKKTQTKQKPISLDFDKTYEVPIFDLILWCKIEVRWVYWNTAKLKIPSYTKPWSKFRVKWFGKKEPWKEGNLIVKIEALMPKNISEVDLSMLERIRENIGY